MLLGPSLVPYRLIERGYKRDSKGRFAISSGDLARSTDPVVVGRAYAMSTANDAARSLAAIEHLETSQLTGLRDENSVMAVALWRERMGFVKPGSSDAEMLALARGDPQALTTVTRRWAKHIRKTELDAVTPQNRADIADAVDRVSSDPRMQAVFDRYGMGGMPVAVGARRLWGSDDNSDMPQAEAIGSGIYVYDASIHTPWGNPPTRALRPASPTPGTTSVGNDNWDTIVTHEVGHTVEHNMTDSQQQSWRDLHNSTYRDSPDRGPSLPTPQDISYYSRTNEKEAFGETFALVMGGSYDKAAYNPESQALITWMEEATS